MKKTCKKHRLVYTGKTKDTYSVKNFPELFILRFKNNVLGKNGIPDSGGNEVIGSIPCKGRACASINSFFMKLFKKNGISIHVLKNNAGGEIVVKKTQRIPIEFICRNLAYGSYLERFPQTRKFAPLGGLIEYSLKSDEAGDPFLSKEQVLNFIGKNELRRIIRTIKKINAVASALCLKKDIELADFKVEFGRLGSRSDKSWESSPAKQGGRLILIDDFSTDTVRFFNGGKLLTCFELAGRLKNCTKKA